MKFFKFFNQSKDFYLRKCHGGFLDRVYESELDTKTEYEEF